MIKIRQTIFGSIVALAAVLFSPAVWAQWNTVPAHGLGVGRGPGFTTPNPVGPCTTNYVLAWTAGVTADPTCFNLFGTPNTWTATQTFNPATSGDGIANFLYGTSGTPRLPGTDLINGYVGVTARLYTGGNMTTAAGVYAVVGDSYRSAGYGGAATGGLFRSYNDGTWTPNVPAGSFTIGGNYVITVVGTTNFMAIGASANTVGVNFVATGVGSGTGTAYLTDAGGIALQAVATSSRGGVIFSGSFNTNVTTIAGAIMRGIEIDMGATAAPDSKVAFTIVSNSGDTAQATHVETIRGVSGITYTDSSAIDILATGGGVGFFNGLNTSQKVGSSGQGVTTGGNLWLHGGYTTNKGLAWEAGVFTTCVICLPGTTYIYQDGSISVGVNADIGGGSILVATTLQIGAVGAASTGLQLAGSTSGKAIIAALAVAGTPTITAGNTSGTIAVGASSPLVLNATTGNLTCPTCLTSSSTLNLVVGTTTIGSGTTTRILYDNAGVLGEYTLTGSGTVAVMQTSPTITGLTVTGSFTATGLVTAADLAATTVTLGSYGSATASPTFTVDAQGRLTAAANATITPAVGSITGLGTGVATALAINVGSAGAFVTFNGAGGTPSSITLTNGTGLPTTGLTGTLQAAQEPAHTGDVTNSAGSLALTIANNAVTLAKLATQATNTVLGNATSGAAVPTALAMTSCSTAGSAVTWTTNTGFGCNTSITAAAVPASGLTGTTLASGVVTSSLTSLGTIANLAMTNAILNGGEAWFLGTTAQATNQNGVLIIGGTNGGTVYARGDNSGGNDHLVLKAVDSVILQPGTTTTATFASGGAVSFPSIASTSAAQTGTVCWATGGNLTVDTTTTCLLSDENAKHNILPITNALDLVMLMDPVSFEYNELVQGEQIGFTAQRMARVDSRLVTYCDGKPCRVRYQQASALYAGAIQQLKADNDNLRAANDNLVTRVQELEQRVR